MRLRPIDLVDVLVYLVVLGVFIQLFPSVLSETFLPALLTAVLLKVVLEVVLPVKKRLVGRIRSERTLPVRAVGGFVAVTPLIVALMLARGGMRRLLTTSEQ